MSNKKQRLELTWIGKDDRPHLEPRILLEDEELSYHASARVTDRDIFDNVLIRGDNLLALKALEQEYTGKVKCVFIDPPYNTGSAFEHYDDGIEHSLWLSLMRARLELLWKFLDSDGSLWITIDDTEGHYLKVLCDEICGRKNFVSTIVWENFYGRSNAAAISPAHNYILVYSPMGQDWKNRRNLLPRDEKSASKYKNPDNDPRGPWRLGPIFAAEERHEGLMYEIRTPSGRSVRPPRGSHWRMTEGDYRKMEADGRISYGENGDNVPAVKLYLNEVQAGLVPRTWWPHSEVGHTQEAKREVQTLFTDEIPFATPKPERLLERILTIATNEGDTVFDSFAGSGTTGAVAHKMGRRWIMVELGEHCETHIVPRLRKVIDGKDQCGITATVEWRGGGGFRYYRLAPSFLEKDAWGNWIISKEYDAAKVAQAVCKLMGFVYQPDETYYWMQGRSSEADFIFVTTQSLTHEQIAAISEEVGDERTLLVCCKAFHADADAFPNLTIKKIPQAVLRKCEWGKDDYSLNVSNLPEAPTGPDTPDNQEPARNAGRRRDDKPLPPQDDLFGQGGSE